MAAVVEFKNYSMGFKDDDGQVFNLLDRVSFQVVSGKARGIVGESGSGKSTLARTILALTKPTIGGK